MNAKKIAAEKAVEEIKDGMTIGLGTGSTAYWAIQKIGERVKDGLKIQAVATSENSEQLARQLKITIASFDTLKEIDLTIDGADEVDRSNNLIKGGGGALLREKIIAFNSKRFLVVVDDSKLVEQLGKFLLPVEIVPFATALTLQQLTALGGNPQLRKKDGALFITDNGNFIADCQFFPINDPAALNHQLHQIPGVVETGLFGNKMVSGIYVGYENGEVRII
jgi:ribose 5-phosphate isomerase A